MYNDYMSPTDTWPQKQQFEMYKEWAMGVEGKAIDTLRNCISTLLVELKDDIQFLLKLIPIQPKEKNLNSCLVCLIKLVTLCPAIQKKKFLNLNQLKIISTHWRQ
jgi:hypothetical protein